MKRVEPDGGIVLVCLYVDDITYAVSRSDMADRFLAELRERFVIEEGEGKCCGLSQSFCSSSGCWGS
jgi:hypothetical protein